MALKTNSRIVLFAGDRALEKGFDRLKGEALGWVFEGYPVGDYYEAALPKRDAFCMRDVSHQCMGAQALGLGRHNMNMFLKFAEGISEKRDYCSYWEIDRYDRPCPVDYAGDADFWYNLPANFDVLDALYRMYRWSGDDRYLRDDRFRTFAALTMEQYIARWDRDGDGLPDRIASEGRRGIASYDEGKVGVRLKVGADLVLAMIRACFSYAEMCRITGQLEYARIYERRGQALLDDINRRWYDPQKGLAHGMAVDGSMIYPDDPWLQKDFVYRGLATPQQAAPLLDRLEARMDDTIIELLSHLTETLWRYGREESALRALRRAMDPSLPRRDYPEASFAAIGAVASGLMGIDPDGEHGAVRTLSGLSDLDFVELLHVSALDGAVSVRHEGHAATELENECDHDIVWRACFPGQGRISVSGRHVPAQTVTMPCSGQTVTCAEIAVRPGERIRAGFTA